MDRDEARSGLRSENGDTRLRAARYFASSALRTDLEVLRAALAIESVVWVRAALRQAIALALGGDPRVQLVDFSTEDPDRDKAEEQNARAVEDVTRRIVHEAEPILGRLRQHAKREVLDFAHSRIARELDRLDSLLLALSRMARATLAPVFTDFDLAQLIRTTIDAHREESVKIDAVGPSPLPVLGDPALVELIFTNGLRNAMEVLSAESTPKAIAVVWDATDREYLVAVIDRGPGLPPGASRVFEMGASTKVGHFGIGLASACLATRGLRGRLSLGPAGERGAKFELRWPKLPGAKR